MWAGSLQKVNKEPSVEVGQSVTPVTFTTVEQQDLSGGARSRAAAARVRWRRVMESGAEVRRPGGHEWSLLTSCPLGNACVPDTTCNGTKDTRGSILFVQLKKTQYSSSIWVHFQIIEISPIVFVTIIQYFDYRQSKTHDHDLSFMAVNQEAKKFSTDAFISLNVQVLEVRVFDVWK